MTKNELIKDIHMAFNINETDVRLDNRTDEELEAILMVSAMAFTCEVDIFDLLYIFNRLRETYKSKNIGLELRRMFARLNTNPHSKIKEKI